MRSFHDGRVVLHGGDCLEVMRGLADNSVDAVVTDPPYHLTSIVQRFGSGNAKPPKNYEIDDHKVTSTGGVYTRTTRGFMGKQWDGGDIAFRPETWAEVLRVLKPGGHLIAFSGTRTYHRMTVAIEDAGFEIRDLIAWLYGSGFPKSHDISKAIDKAAGEERKIVGVDPQAARRNKTTSKFSGVYGDINDTETCPLTAPATSSAIQWSGWGTALKPAIEPICLARKPLGEATIAANVLKHGTGAIHIDACRVEMSAKDADYITERIGGFNNTRSIGGNGAYGGGQTMDRAASYEPKGRWPANVTHDGSDEVIAAFPETGPSHPPCNEGTIRSNQVFGADLAPRSFHAGFPDDNRSAARFFYSAKADANNRIGSKHPTVKPVDLMRWLCRLICPPGGTILDPFAGTGTTGEAAFFEGFRSILIEREAEYQDDIRRRMEHIHEPQRVRKETIVKAKGKIEAAGPLFAEQA